MKLLFVFLVAPAVFAQVWEVQSSGTTASLRGVSAVNAKIVWASGSDGTWLRTTDGGQTWHSATVPGAADLDFRGVKAIDANTAYLLSSGSGDKSRLFKTTDAGVTWKLLFTNPDAKGFFDAIALRDVRHGVIAGDPVDGEMTIFTTEDGGLHWTRRRTVPALPDEGAFAASNSCLALTGAHDVWFGTGGTGAGRVLHSADDGATWTVTETPIRNDVASAGIFSIAFSDLRHGIAVGGDYAKDTEKQRTIAMTMNGGGEWVQPPMQDLNGYRSAVIWLASRRVWLATGTSGSDISSGNTWRKFDSGSYNALSASGDSVWAVGAKGRIATIKFPD